MKKGNKEILNNHRTESCLPAASKLLERIVCVQLSAFVEENQLLPGNQQGFRSRRSTMTAWADIQKDWVQNFEDKNMTGSQTPAILSSKIENGIFMDKIR